MVRPFDGVAADRDVQASSLAAIFVKLPDTVTCPFLLVPVGETQTGFNRPGWRSFTAFVCGSGTRSRCTSRSTFCAPTKSAIGARNCGRWAKTHHPRAGPDRGRRGFRFATRNQDCRKFRRRKAK